MRRVRAAFFSSLLLLLPAWSGAQDSPAPNDALNEMNSSSLTADDDAQLSLGGFRGYLERIHATDPALYTLLDPRLDSLESLELSADVVFWTATGLGVAAAAAGIAVYEEVGVDEGVGLIIAGASTFLLGLIIQAILRPGHQDLVALIDMHDERVGRR